MKRLLFLLLLLIAAVSAWAGPPSAPPLSNNPSFGDVTADSITVGDPISVVDTEYPIWEAVDINGDVVASATVECSVLTDGAQVCQIHYYVMSDIAGTLTNELTIDVSSD